MAGVTLAGGATSLFLHYNNHANVIGEEVRHSFEREVGSDVVIVCEGGSVAAHRLILATASPWLKSIFDGVPSSGDTGSSTLLLPDVKHSDMLLLVQFIYCGEVTLPLMQLGVIQELIILLQLDAGQVNEKFFLEPIRVQGMSHCVSAAVVVANEDSVLPSNISSHQGSNGSAPSLGKLDLRNESMVKSGRGSSFNPQNLPMGSNSIDDSSLVPGLKPFEFVPALASVTGELPNGITSKAKGIDNVLLGDGEISRKSLTFLEGLNKPTTKGTRKRRGPKKGLNQNHILLNPNLNGRGRPRKIQQSRSDRKNQKTNNSSKSITTTKRHSAPLPGKSTAKKISTPTTSINLRSRTAPKLTKVEKRMKIENENRGTKNAVVSGDVFSSDNMDTGTDTGAGACAGNTSKEAQELLVCCFCLELFESEGVLRSHISEIHCELLEPNDASI